MSDHLLNLTSTSFYHLILTCCLCDQALLSNSFALLLSILFLIITTLVSCIPDGFFTCRSGEMVTGSHYDNYKISTQTVFKFQAVSDANVRRALEIVHLSDQIKNIQSTYKGSNDVCTYVRVS